MTLPAYGSAELKRAPSQQRETHQEDKVHPAPHLVSEIDSRRGQPVEVSRAMSEGRYESDVYLDFQPDSLGLAHSLTRRQIQTAAAAIAPRSIAARFLKRGLDVVGAVGLAVLFAPLIVAVIALLHRDGTVIYRHRRVGQGGRIFECLKFRTMVPNADRVLHEILERNDELKAEWLEGYKLRHDPRVTKLGRFLRRTSLDELPQLWNVLRGDMSLVGPRPIVREELLRYGRSASLYLAVKPGVTGLWQTMGRNELNYRRRVAIDVYYVRNSTLLLDVYILLRTARVVLAGDGAY